MRLLRACLLLPLASLCLLAQAAAPDLETGKAINGTCAACHGADGKGGKHGEYPRLAGQHAKYIEYTLKSFRSRERVNIPMFPYTQERELSDQDIIDVAAYLAAIELPTTLPKFKDSDDALTRLTAVQRVMLIPRVDGDIDAGKTVYQARCATCHGDTGRGKRLIPMITGQYPTYLMRQMELFRAGERPHDEEKAGEGALKDLAPEALQNILAYLTTLQNLKDPE
ncbi:MAG: c-type cytochrome [Rhodocyclaceae bacterium]|nr:c-type cytochrome [Rhodocyclaceae bacterium]